MIWYTLILLLSSREILENNGQRSCAAVCVRLFPDTVTLNKRAFFFIFFFLEYFQGIGRVHDGLDRYRDRVRNSERVQRHARERKTTDDERDISHDQIAARSVAVTTRNTGLNYNVNGGRGIIQIRVGIINPVYKTRARVRVQ